MFEFGYAQEDITPKYGAPLCGYLNLRPNRGALDRLKVKAAAFRTGGEDNAVIVSFDLCMVTAALVRKMSDAIAAELPMLAGKVMFSATHTHTGPFTTSCFANGVDNDYLELLIGKTLSAVRFAHRNLAPAELSATQTECSTPAFNRRYVMKNGKVLTNPGKLNPDIVRPEGTIDPAIPFFAVRQFGHYRLIAVNISNHADTTGGDLVSADWPGHLEKQIQYELGEEVPVMTLIAPQGNINHFNVKTDADQTSPAESRRIGKAYAAAVLSSLYQLRRVEVQTLRTASYKFDAPYYTVTDEEYEEAKRVFEANRDAIKPGQDITSEDIARGTPYALKYFAQCVIDCRDRAIKTPREEQMFALRFGNEIGIVGIPAEPFAEIGIAIRKASDFPLTMVAALTMGEIGYVGLPENYGVGGYETNPSRAKADRTVGKNLIRIADELLRQLRQ